MAQISITNEIASKFLGKTIKGFEKYNPSILVAVPRSDNRTKYGIISDNLPFEGFDVWHCYEFSVLTLNGLPVTRILKLKYSSFSKYIVESKSLKLYFNSFNMSKFGRDVQECLNICKSKIEYDLSQKLETPVEISFFNSCSKSSKIFKKYVSITDISDVNSIKISEFKEAPNLLKFSDSSRVKKYYLYFDSLRSNCRVTHQPDFGEAFIYYKSDKKLDNNSLIKYLVSFRNEYHFHEECCEMIYKRIFDMLHPKELMVCSLYTRRGGIDISSVRYTKNINLPDVSELININKFVRHGIMQ